MCLVMGITGRVGGVAARNLLNRGKQVRALVRDREKAAQILTTAGTARQIQLAGRFTF